jgi:hypothetical protein
MRHAQGEPVKTDFELNKDNIDEYLNLALDMDKKVRRLNIVNDLKHKLSHLDELDDELYTEEYLLRRLEKVMAEQKDEDTDEICNLKGELARVNGEIDIVRPLVFDMVEGQKPENHIKMSDLDDDRKRLEEEINTYYKKQYPKLEQHLPKIYYMVLEGCDMDTVVSCFRKMKMVLMDSLSPEEASNELMDESTSKYNLPSTIYDPIRNRATKKPGKKGKKNKK